MDFSLLQKDSRIADEWRYPPATANRTGHLAVDDSPSHRIYWEEYGNPAGEPVMFLHGGPGGACAPAMARFFDPARYRVILFDQRGCGKSEPTVASAGPARALAHNTTQYLVGDISRLRAALGIDGKMHVFGGSWGSSLAMAYAIAHPEHCANLILRGIFLGRPEDLRYLYQGNAATYADAPDVATEPGAYMHYPAEWEKFLSVVPPAERGDVMAAYKALFDMEPASDADRDRQREAAIQWSTWEGAISNMIPDTVNSGKFGEADYALCFAQIEAHYFANGIFLEPGYFLDHAAVLARIPMHIVHGRFDQVCSLGQASALARALAGAGRPPATFVITNAGHSAMERDTALALTAIMDGLPPLEA
ncbi:prolyl aminopeptidase [Sphingopyxis panaciterrae]